MGMGSTANFGFLRNADSNSDAAPPATVRVAADPASRWRDKRLLTQSGPAQVEGLMALERRDPAGCAFCVGGTRTLESTAWKWVRLCLQTAHHFAVGITNSAPLAMLAGQRCMTDFCLV